MNHPLGHAAKPRLVLEADAWGDPTPDSVYAAISKPLVQAGAGDDEIYKAFAVVQEVFTRVYEMQKRMGVAK